MAQKVKNIFLFMCHTFEKETAQEYQKILRATKGIGETCVLFHFRGNKLPSKLEKSKRYSFTDESLSHLKYSMFRKSITDGNCHFALLQFFLDNPEYDFYWLIEYDVRFSGDWRQFFNYFDRSKADLLSCYIRNYADTPNWPWWGLKHPTKEIPLQERYASFEPIYRLSNRSLKLLDLLLRDGWRGHQEVVIPTLLYHYGFRLRDFGGEGKFVKPRDENRFYLYNSTLRWRPLIKRVGKNDHKLYHPVKPLIKSCNKR